MTSCVKFWFMFNSPFSSASSSFLSSFIDMTDHAKFSNIIFIVKSVLSVATVAPFGIEALKKRNDIGL